MTPESQVKVIPEDAKGKITEVESDPLSQIVERIRSSRQERIIQYRESHTGNLTLRDVLFATGVETRTPGVSDHLSILAENIGSDAVFLKDDISDQEFEELSTQLFKDWFADIDNALEFIRQNPKDKYTSFDALNAAQRNSKDTNLRRKIKQLAIKHGAEKGYARIFRMTAQQLLLACSEMPRENELAKQVVDKVKEGKPIVISSPRAKAKREGKGSGKNINEVKMNIGINPDNPIFQLSPHEIYIYNALKANSLVSKDTLIAVLKPHRGGKDQAISWVLAQLRKRLPNLTNETVVNLRENGKSQYKIVPEDKADEEIEKARAAREKARLEERARRMETSLAEGRPSSVASAKKNDKKPRDGQEETDSSRDKPKTIDEKLLEVFQNGNSLSVEHIGSTYWPNSDKKSQLRYARAAISRIRRNLAKGGKTLVSQINTGETLIYLSKNLSEPSHISSDATTLLPGIPIKPSIDADKIVVEAEIESELDELGDEEEQERVLNDLKLSRTDDFLLTLSVVDFHGQSIIIDQLGKKIDTSILTRCRDIISDFKGVQYDLEDVIRLREVLNIASQNPSAFARQNRGKWRTEIVELLTPHDNSRGAGDVILEIIQDMNIK